MDKSHVSMEQKMCPVCGKKFDSGAILLDRRLKQSMDKHTVTGFDLCPEHKQKFCEGFIALVVTDETKSNIDEKTKTIKQENAYRTGEIVHMKREAFNKLFDTEVDNKMPMVFIDPVLFNKLKTLVK